MIFRRSYSDPFRRTVSAACHGSDPFSALLGATTAQEQADQASFQAQVARNNQQVAQGNAQRALQQGQIAEDRARQNAALAIGSQRAALASQGGDVDSGSALDLVGDTARTGAFNALTARNEGQNNAYRFQLAANADAGDASLDDTKASNIWTNYNNSLLGSTLGATTQTGGLLLRAGGLPV